MANQLITIFGGSGFIGRHLVGPLAKTGARIRVALRNPNEGLFLKPMGDVGQIQLIQANIRYPESIARAVSGADAVVNLVGILQSGGKQSFKNVHEDGAEAVARAASDASVPRLIHVSAIGADLESSSAYAKSKARGEQAVQMVFPTATILRPSIVFGPEDDFFNRFAAMARMAPALPLVGGGKTRFQPVYVGDVAQAISATLSDPKAAGQTYELGGPRVYTFEEVLQYILSVTERKRPMVALPFWMAKLISYFVQMIPNAPITPDQVESLRTDNVVSDDASTLADLGINPQSIEAIVPAYLHRFRKSGQFD